MSVYLDHAASTPVRQIAQDAFTDALAHVGNPSSVHRHGQHAKDVVESAREVVAGILGCEPIEVIFTSGGTEAINLAIVGLYRHRTELSPHKNSIIVPEAEHHATQDTVQWLETHDAAQPRWIPVDQHGRIEIPALEKTLSLHASETAVMSAIWANNEVGTIQPVHRVAELAAEYSLPLHIDAVAACGHEQINFAQLRSTTGAQKDSGLMALSISGHKFGAVPGVGALIVSRHAQLLPLIHGGGQQRGLRSGTMDAPAVASLAAALTQTYERRDAEEQRLRALRDKTIAGIQSIVPDAQLSGDPTDRLAYNVNFTFPGCQSDSLLFLLDAHGISVSTGSACQAGVAEPSHVLLAMGHDERGATSALRITLGHTTTDDDIDAFLAALPDAVERARRAGITA
jgi:cysteine desulfurase